jgi:hypothetical protein
MAKANESAKLPNGTPVVVVEVNNGKAEVIVSGTDKRVNVPAKDLK